jgi:O-antigen/teichoic acid export membrane protein
MGLYGFTMYAVIYEKKTGAIAMITLVAGAVSIGLNLLLIPGCGMMAAAWVKLLSSALTLCLGWFYSQRCLPLDFKWLTTASIIAPAILLLFIANLFGSDHGGVDLLLKISFFLTFVFLLLRANRGFVKRILAALGETRSVIAEEVE